MRRGGQVLAGALVAGVLAGLGGAPATAAPAKLRLEVLSGRADLVSGGDALVAVHGVRSTRGLHVRVGRKDVTRAFAPMPDGTIAGVITGLRPRGRTSVTAQVGRRGARLLLTDHPIGGPVFSGPQLTPWRCQSSAKDAQCNEPASFGFLYKSRDPLKSGLRGYDPGHPPSDVATTTTDQGVTVPFVVRVERGYIDRDRYAIATLYQPGKPWTPQAPQRQFNHKLLITHGASCGADHTVGGAPSVTGGAAETALGRGFMTMSHALDNAGHNCNVASEAEALVMTKEHLVERYGTLRYTIGTGCSGGSLAIQWIANAYPGIYQGILPQCSFPDAWSTASQFLDYHLALDYFKSPARWGSGLLWLEPQMASVVGHISLVNPQVSDTAQFHVIVPTDACKGVTAAERYDPVRNPGGVRCTILDAAMNVFGPRDRSVWTAQEQQIGRGFAGSPVDNVGVQYGLSALRDGIISPAQFVDLNVKIGGLSLVNAEITSQRLRADRPALANAYRSGMINEANNLDQTAIIDCRGPDPGLFHDAYRAFAMRARLDREHGGHANQVIWEGPVPIIADASCEVNAFTAMDRWLGAVERDGAGGTLAQRVARDRPADVTDSCYSGVGQKLNAGLCPLVVPTYGTPRTVAGDAISTDTNKCALKPLDRGGYGSAKFTDAQWAALQKVFPEGVCDFSKPGVDQQGTVPWQTYQDARGRVVYGGRPLGAAPRSRSFTVR